MEERKRIEIGDAVGRWTVIGPCEITQRNERKWLCRCSCGTERYVLERSLLHGGSRSCGCYKVEQVRQAVSHELAGKQFGELTVLERVYDRDKRRGIWWRCECSCGNTVDVPGTLLVTGKRTHCGCKKERRYSFCDISGQKFHRLTALYPLDERDAKGSVIWHCRCECGNEVDVAYNTLMYTNMKSCGCQKKEHDRRLGELLTHVAGTSIDYLRSKKVPKSNSTGAKGVYLIRGKYTAKIVFQKKQYWLGSYENLEDAVNARKEAEETINDQVTDFYRRWKERADADPEWAEQNPIRISAEKRDSKIQLHLSPKLP